ncbi:GntR family transcriptional regulator [Arthrobacter sp. C9C5]|uniref:GntR family transcriptional regulator n=1 Tax=Arthrobacter sp. C9C5 TaxID=2735267 RepID=UPI0015845FDF|nr:GntR family transcriptional regulator [Arthrobacter sp. C9C5]NUU30311.1 GntR family transcriptional regulator [Arthrobacter sp. C9C5]
MTAGISIDLRSATPPYEQIRAQIASLVAIGALPPGTRLPTVRRLAADLGIAAGTVARAYKELEQTGLIQTGRRNGTVVAAPAGGDGPGGTPGDAVPARPAPGPNAAVIAAVDRCIAAGRAAGLDDGALLAVMRARLGQRHEYGGQDTSQ